MGSWRFPFSSFVLPMTLLSLVTVYFGVPPTKTSRVETGRGDYLDGFKKVLSNRSALACLLGLMVSALAINGPFGYYSSYIRQKLGASTTFASVMMVLGALSYVGGSQIAGRVIKSIGSKKLWVIAYIVGGVGAGIAYNISNVWAALALSIPIFVMIGMGFTASNHLTLMQVPQFRGTIMSLFTAANSLGTALGSAIGGMILLSYDYGFLGVAALILGLLASTIIHTMTQETEKS